MPTYNILGLQVFIPDLSDLTNAVVAPLTNFVSSLLNNVGNIVANGLNSVISFFQSLVQQITTALSSIFVSVASSIQSAIGSLTSFILNGINTITSFIVQVGNSLQSALVSAFNQLYAFIHSNVVIPAQSFFTQLAGAIQSALNFIANQFNGFVSFIQNGIAKLAADILNSLNQVYNGLAAIIADFGHVLNNIGTFVVNGFNQLSTGISAAFNAVGNALGTIWHDFIQALNTYIIQPVLAGINDTLNGISNVLRNIQNSIKNAIISLLPKTPDDAFNSALAVAEIGGLTFVSGEVISLALEALYPTKHLGIPEALHKGLELLGITELTAAFYAIIIRSGWGRQLEYFFNYQLQPRRMDVNTALRGLWYGVLDEQQVINELRYEGYNNEAINAIIQTAYRPMPPFLLSRLLELQVVSNDFALKQLRMLGFPPDQVNEILKGFQNLTLQGFQSNAKSLVYNMYKNGFINEELARQIMNVFAVPADQQNWVLTLANYDFKFEQQILLRDYVIRLFKGNAISADDAVDLLVQIGMDKSRAEILVKIAGITQAPPPPKSVRAEIFKEALALKLEVS